MKKVIAVVVAIAAVIALIVWWTGRDRGEPRPSAATGSAAIASASSAARPVDAPARGRIEGWVRDGAGQAIAGAMIQVVDAGPPQAVGPDGNFAIDDLDVGTYAVVASAPGYVSSREAETRVVAGQATRVTLTLAPGGHAITGVVSDVSGGPIEGATVTASRRLAFAAVEATAVALTDRDGRYRLTVAPGSYQIAGDRDDYVRASADLEVVDADRTLDLRLVPGGVVEGVVRDVASGAVVAGARVEAAGDPLGPLGIGRRATGATTDADGRFRLAGLTPGALRLSARVAADGRQSRESVQVLLGIGEQRADVELWVEAAPYLAGRVVDQDGKPIAEASVLAIAAGAGDNTSTDADGRFRITGLEPGTFEIMVTHRRFNAMPPRRVVLEATPITDLLFTLTASPRVVGTVVPATEAIINVDPDRGPESFGMIMTMGASMSQAGTDGRFEVTPIEPGTHVLVAKAADGRRGQATVVVPAQGDVAVTIQLADGASIAGTVRDQHGQPVPGVSVRIRRTSGAVNRRVIINGVETSSDNARTASDGSYRMRGLEAGSYELSVHDELGGALPMRARGRNEPVAVRLAADENKRGVDLTIEQNDGVIRGVVTGPNGAPKADAWVTAVLSPESLMPRDDPDAGGSGTAMAMVMISDDGGGGAGAGAPVLTDEQGRFELRGLRSGVYDVVAEAERGGLRGRARGIATGASAAIKLSGLGAIEGVVTTPTGPAPDFTVTLDGPTPHGQRYRSADGRFRIDRLEPGTYTVSVSGASGSGQASVAVSAGADRAAAVTIALTADGEVTGRLLTADGAPVASVPVLAMPGGPGHSGQVTMEGPPEITRADGRFTLTLAPGTYTLLALRPDASPRTDISFTIIGGQTIDLGDVKLPAAGPPGPPPPGAPGPQPPAPTP